MNYSEFKEIEEEISSDRFYDNESTLSELLILKQTVKNEIDKMFEKFERVIRSQKEHIIESYREKLDRFLNDKE